ncbi:MAG TPA: gfo/Idh/MocA family oxidoreductase [Bacteroidales bacterium]|nr:gfo/Idh/MocA family oxidoreductase [Bacteroidales bacterium]
MDKSKHQINRRKFLSTAGAGFASFAILPNIMVNQQEKSSIRSNEEPSWEQDPTQGWIPVSDRKIRVGLVGYGASKFAAAFSFQHHPNVEVIAVSDLFPDRCAELAKVTKCNKTYPSLEEMVKDDKIEAVFVATDAPGHARHCIEVLKHGKHVACAVPAVFGSLEDADLLFEAVKKSGLKYMMFETSCYRPDNYAMRQIYNAGVFGKIVYAEGEYYGGGMPTPTSTGTPSYKNWRVGMPPQWYCTHGDAYFVGVTNGSFTEVSCLGMQSLSLTRQPGKNVYNNPFGTEIALHRTSEGGMARMARSNDTPGFGAEAGRVRGQRGSFYGKYEGLEKNLPDLNRPPLPPGVEPGGHGGSHGPLMNEFVLSILEDRKPLVDIAMALNMTVGGIVAHASAMKNGEWMKIPQYKF